MRQIFAKLHSAGASWMIVPVACALVVIGAKCWMIGQYGSQTPFWDQWKAEGAFLFPKYFDGTLLFSDLIALHNEHRILMTRLWSLLLLELGGYWDPLLQMAANTLLYGAVVALIVAAFRPILDGASWIVFALFSTVVFALPFGWENTLAGFHSQWYFMLLFSIAGLLAIIEASAFTPRWWLATLLLLASYFSMASGALTLAAALAVCLVQTVVRRRSGARELLALAILATVMAGMVFYTPVLAHHSTLMAHSIREFVNALVGIASWPVVANNKAIAYLAAIVIHAPAILASIHVIGLRPPLADRRWLLVALTGWAALQAATVAFGRAEVAISSRYLDVFAIALLLNCACLLYFLRASRDSTQRRRLVFGAVTLWLILVLAGAAKYVRQHSMPDLAEKRTTSLIQTKNMRAYLDTGDIGVLENKPRRDIPYPNVQLLADVASSPVIRALLPPILVGEASAARAQQRGLARFTGRPIEAFKDAMLRWGVLLMPVGAALFLLGFAGQWRRRGSGPASQLPAV